EFVATFLGASNLLQGTVREMGAERAVVEVAGVALQVRGRAPQVGQAAVLALRPEKVRVAAPGRITVRLKDVVYRGAQTHLYGELNGIQIAAFVPNGDVEPVSLEPGQELGLDWDDGSLVLLE